MRQLLINRSNYLYTLREAEYNVERRLDEAEYEREWLASLARCEEDAILDAEAREAGELAISTEVVSPNEVINIYSWGEERINTVTREIRVIRY